MRPVVTQSPRRARSRRCRSAVSCARRGSVRSGSSITTRNAAPGSPQAIFTCVDASAIERVRLRVAPGAGGRRHADHRQQRRRRLAVAAVVAACPRRSSSRKSMPSRNRGSCRRRAPRASRRRRARPPRPAPPSPSRDRGRSRERSGSRRPPPRSARAHAIHVAGADQPAVRRPDSVSRKPQLARELADAEDDACPGRRRSAVGLASSNGGLLAGRRGGRPFGERKQLVAVVDEEHAVGGHRRRVHGAAHVHLGKHLLLLAGLRAPRRRRPRRRCRPCRR